ncbi:MAG TPA: class I SAM-dependent methyltransferase, partial [Paracoccaceae bacterium]|nr:class I SAM-dependent methyltransferase [Paracoccaceae bacterium]
DAEPLHEVAEVVAVGDGVAPGRAAALTPRDRAPETAGPVDLAVSYLSCGFHYPVDLYLPFLHRALEPGGAAIFDLRASTAAEQAAKLAALGALTDLPAPPKARRVMLVKA